MRRSWAVKTTTVMIVAAALALGGCGEESNQKATQAAQKLYDGLAERYCEYIFRCCDADEAKAVANRRFTDKASCSSYTKLDYLLDSYTLQLSAAQGGVELDEQAVDACLAAWKALSCDVPISQLKAPKVCDYKTVMTGQRAAGQGCAAIYECEAGNNCVKAFSSSSQGVCLPFRKQGEPCSSSINAKDACAAGLVCALPKDDGMRTCKPAAKAGEACDEVACDSDDPDLFCDAGDPNKKVCTKRKGSGEACTSPITCKTGLYCDSFTDPQNPRCRAPAGAGQPCKTEAQCKTDHCCDMQSDPGNPTCKVRRDEGQPCNAPHECKSSNCDFNTMTCGPGGGGTTAAVCDGK